MNDIGYNRGMVYGDIGASDRGPGSKGVGLEPWEAEKSQKWKIGRNKVGKATFSNATCLR